MAKKSLKRLLSDATDAVGGTKKSKRMPLLRTLHPEVKFFDTSEQGIAVASAGVLENLNGLIPADSTDNGRVGNRISIIGVELRGYVTLATTASADQISLLLFQDKQPNGAAVTTLYSTTVNGTNTAPFQGQATSLGCPLLKNVSQGKRFSVLWHKDMQLQQFNAYWNGTARVSEVSTTAGGATGSAFYKNIKFKKPIIAAYSTSSGAITDIQTNLLYFAFASTGAGVSTMRFLARVYYTDV